MYQRWLHYRMLHGTCPDCGAPAHIGVSLATGRACWLHDKYPGLFEYYDSHDYGHPPKTIERDEAIAVFDDARRRGIEVYASAGRSKRVRCVESGETFGSIQEAADWAGVSRPSLSVAVKKGTRSGGYHWQTVGE